MWIYEKRLQYPVNIKETNAKLASDIISQYGGPDGEMGASMRYLSQRYAMPYKECSAILTDVGTEELAHLEIVAAIIYQLTKNLSMEEIKASGFDKYYIDHTTGIWPQAAGGVPFNACEFQSKGDPITDLYEDMAAEGTIAKEQPVFRTPEKALFHAGFGTFAPHAQNRRLRHHIFCEYCVNILGVFSAFVNLSNSCVTNLTYIFKCSSRNFPQHYFNRFVKYILFRYNRNRSNVKSSL